jgi:hypothetical protein
MDTKDTDPVIIDELCNGLTQWYHQGWVTANVHDRLVPHQNIIGWNGIIEGCFSHKWEERQELYFQVKGSRRSGFKWQVELCKRIWQIPWDMWSHRNSVEHANDTQKLLQKIMIEVQEEITKGNDNDVDIDRFIQEATQPSFNERTAPYQKGWLRGIKALRARKHRRGLEDRVLHNMRRIMRNFIHQ